MESFRSCNCYNHKPNCFTGKCIYCNKNRLIDYIEDKSFKWLDYIEWYFHKYGEIYSNDNKNIEDTNNQYKQEFFE